MKKTIYRIVRKMENDYQIHIFPDKLFLKAIYYCSFGKELDLKNPKTFNEKLQWLKLYDRKPEYVQMVDKYEAKKYVADIIGDQYIIPTYGVWDSFDEIDFNTLPNQFVLKCTHDSGGLAICRDKSTFNIDDARNKINAALKRNFYYVGREWPYKNIKPRIIAEKYLEDKNRVVPEDYKIYCMNGEPYYTVVFHNRFNQSEELSETVYDIDWNPLPVSFDNHFQVSEIIEPKPNNYDELISVCKKLCSNTIQSRIDFYIVNDRIYFGEITLYTASGFQPMIPEIMDEELGKLIKLPENRGGVLVGHDYVLLVKQERKIKELTDYKFYCFNGEPKFLYISEGLENHETARISFLTTDWKFAPFHRDDYMPFEKLPEKPQRFDEMLEIAKRLSGTHKFMRVDIYEVNGQIYFGELTFYPSSGFIKFNPEEYDRKLGDLLEL